MEQAVLSEKGYGKVVIPMENEVEYDTYLRERYQHFIKLSRKALNGRYPKTQAIQNAIEFGEPLLRDVRGFIQNILEKNCTLDEVDEFLFTEIESFRIDVSRMLQKLRVHKSITLL